MMPSPTKSRSVFARSPFSWAVAFSLFAWILVFGLLHDAKGATSGATAGQYAISIGDVVSFDFLDDTLPAQQLTVANDGKASFPLVGGVSIVGLSAPEAEAAVRKAFVDAKFFIQPQISLSLESYRPFFVLGDVNAPGSFAFQPTLTVEQAVAMAGGQSTGGATAEDRVVARARLRGDLDEASALIAREAVSSARVTAQLAGRVEIEDGDLPAKAREFVSSTIIASLLPTEQLILEAEQRGYETRHAQLTAAVGEVNGALANLGQMVEKQNAAIVSAQSELDRAKELNRRGLKTLTDLAGVEREASSQESHLLEIFNQMSTTRRELGELQRLLADVTDNRTRGALTELQGHNAEIERLLVARQSTEEQILLVSSLAAEEARDSDTIVFSYQIRRKSGAGVETSEAALDDAVAPGDTILVSIDRPDTAPGLSLAETTLGQIPGRTQ